MKKFKVGDKVEIIRGSAKGATTKITRIVDDEKYYGKWTNADGSEDRVEFWMPADRLRLISSNKDMREPCSTKKYLVVDMDEERLESICDSLDEAQKHIEDIDDDFLNDFRIYEVTKAYKAKKTGLKFVETDL